MNKNYCCTKPHVSKFGHCICETTWEQVESVPKSDIKLTEGCLYLLLYFELSTKKY